MIISFPPGDAADVTLRSLVEGHLAIFTPVLCATRLQPSGQRQILHGPDDVPGFHHAAKDRELLQTFHRMMAEWRFKG